MINKSKQDNERLNVFKKTASKRMIWLYLFALLSLTNQSSINAQYNKLDIKKETVFYDYQKLLHTNISELTNEIIKKVMLQRLNEIRATYKKPALVIDTRLEDLASNFAKEKTGTERRTDPYMHFDRNNLGIIDRAKEAKIWNQINAHPVNNEVMGLWECLVWTDGTIEEMLQSLMNSPTHKKWLLNPYVTKVGFGYDKWYNILVQIFADFKTTVSK